MTSGFSSSKTVSVHVATDLSPTQINAYRLAVVAPNRSHFRRNDYEPAPKSLASGSKSWPPIRRASF